MVTERDTEYMRMAMELAGNGHGFVHPNPYVGAVIVKNDRVIGKGWHTCYGKLHAEREAFANLTEGAEGATMYVTLEPCCHYGKTPPCTEAIIENRVARVFVGLLDPNPKVAGKGIEILRDAGIEVECGLLESELKEQNRIFLKYITTGMPWVAMKCAMTLDGKIATHTGDSKWVSGMESRNYSQCMRNEFAAIMVGIGTVNADNPMLNCRLCGDSHQPIRIIADSGAHIALDSAIVQSAKEYRTIVAHTSKGEASKLNQLRNMGIETLLCEECNGHIDVMDMLRKLGAMKIDSIILEGGGTLNNSFVAAGAIDEVYAFIAPKIVGGKEAKTPVEGYGVDMMSDALELHDVRVECCGDDVLIRGRVG